MSADLHLHTYYSDGNWSPETLVNRANELGFRTISLTDHDTVAGLEETRHFCHERGIRLINGIEFNTIWKDANGKPKDVHILGYFIDPQNSELLAQTIKQQDARLEQIKATINRFQSKGHAITFDDVARQSARGSLGRPHICKAMMELGITNDAQKAYQMLMNHDSEFRVERQSITPAEAIRAIAQAGGISSLAHPGKDKEIESLLKELVPLGLNAIEAYHRGHTLSLVKKYSKMATKMGLLITGGSDCHGPFENFKGSIGTIRLTPELVQKLDKFIEARN